MEWGVILALVLALPLILFPVAYVWYVNIGGLVAAIRKTQKKAAREVGTGVEAKVQPLVRVAFTGARDQQRELVETKH